MPGEASDQMVDDVQRPEGVRPGFASAEDLAKMAQTGAAENLKQLTTEGTPAEPVVPLTAEKDLYVPVEPPEPGIDVLVRADVDVEEGGSAVEAGADEEIDDGERADDVVAIGKLLVEHRQEAGEAGAGIVHDAGIEAWLIKHLRLDQHLPGEGVHGGFRAAHPPADPLIDQSPGLGVGATKTALGVLG